MSTRRVIAYLMACAAFLASFLIYIQYVYQLGFPDGFISELGRAERRLAYIAIGLSMLFGSLFLYLGARAARAQTSTGLYGAIALYLLALVTIALVDSSYRLQLTDGGGG